MNKTTRTHRCTKGLLLVFTATLLAVLALGVALNLVAAAPQVARMYWTDAASPMAGDGKIQRANPDGSTIEDLVTTGLTMPTGIALDIAGGKMYWTNAAVPFAGSKIQRADLNGDSVEDLVCAAGCRVTSTLTLPYGIALNVAEGKMYWTDAAGNKIQRANLNGSSAPENLVTTIVLTKPVGIALDVAGGKMYWTEQGNASKPDGKVQRANLDGSAPENLVVTTALTAPTGIALDVAGGKMYWTDPGMQSNPDGKIQRANLNGDSVEDLVCAAGCRVTSTLTMPIGIALDVAGGKMYWADAGAAKIQCANLDGSNIKDLVTTGLTLPLGIALELVQEPPPEPVGGIVVPVNKLGLVAPWMGVAALAGLAALRVVLAKRRWG